MKILLSPPSSADSHRQQALHHPITTVSESQLTHYLKLQAAQQQIQAPLALIKSDPAVEVLSSEPPTRSTVATAPQRQFHHLPVIKSEAMPSTTETSQLSAQPAPPQHQPLPSRNGNHLLQSHDAVVRKSPKFATTSNQPPLPHKKLIMGKIEHSEALENEAAMQQHAQNLLQLSQEPLVLHSQRASPAPAQQQHRPQPEREKEPPPVQEHAEDLAQHHSKLRDSSVGYFMEVGPSPPSIRLTTAVPEMDSRNADAVAAERQQQQQRHLQQYNAALLQSRIFPKDEPMSPRWVGGGD